MYNEALVRAVNADLERRHAALERERANREIEAQRRAEAGDAGATGLFHFHRRRTASRRPLTH